MSSLTGLIAPAPGILTVVFRRKSDDAPVDVPNAEIRLRSPSGALTSLPVTRVATGTYQAGSLASPIVLDGVGQWRAEGHSPVVGDLVYPDAISLTVASDGFPSGSSPLPAVVAAPGNPWAGAQVTTTDATPTLLLRIPVAADQGVWVQPTSWPAMVLRLDGANAGDSTSLSLYGPLRRIGAAAPTTIPGLVWIPVGSFYPTPPTGLVGIAAAATISTDHIDVMVTGLVGATIRWTWPAPALLYF